MRFGARLNAIFVPTIKNLIIHFIVGTAIGLVILYVIVYGVPWK